MRSSATSDAVLLGLFAGLAFGCGAGGPLANSTSDGHGDGGRDTADADGGTAGAADQSTAGASGVGGSTADPGADGGVAGAADGGAGADGGGGVGGTITTIVPTKGCGQGPGQEIGVLVMHTIQTMGTKATGCADANCAPWSYAREYFVTLPTGYDDMKAYPLLLEEPGCGSQGNLIYDFAELDSSAIRVGLSPPPNDIGHALYPGQSCFDDREGDDSVDWVFYETLYDQLAKTLCFDRHRVFSSGHDSGGFFSNELGCKYAGDATRPVRGVLPVGGGLPTDPRYLPTCTAQPMAGMWIHSVADTVNPFAGTIVAINRAMRVNGCTLGTGYNDATYENFPISTVTDGTCKKITGCPDLYPLVVCPLLAPARVITDNVPDNGIPTFIKLFESPPLLPQ